MPIIYQRIATAIYQRIATEQFGGAELIFLSSLYRRVSAEYDVKPEIHASMASLMSPRRPSGAEPFPKAQADQLAAESAGTNSEIVRRASQDHSVEREFLTEVFRQVTESADWF